MKSTIYKYQLDIVDEQTIKIPSLHQILSVGEQYGTLCMWVGVDADSPPVDVRIAVYGTGYEVRGSDRYTREEFVGTVIMDSFVWHIFKRSDR